MGNDQSSAVGSSSRDTPHGKQKAKLDDIIVVSSKSEGKKEEGCDEDVQHLKNITLSNPILLQCSGSETENVKGKLPRISSVSFTEMLLRYQFYLTECAEAVSFDQNVLSKRIKEINTLAASISKNLNERYKSIENAISQVDKVSEISNMVEKIELNLNNTKLQFNVLNKYLPEEEQIHDPEFNS